MHILIAAASRHGSTRAIAAAIAQELRTTSHIVEVRNVEEPSAVELYDAVIVGSAIYMGDWLAEARQFVDRNRVKLAGVPVWLFSSGPLGQDNPRPKGNPTHLDELMEATGARDHWIFVGKLDKRGLGVGERLIVRMVKAPEGDFRDWAAIRAWAHAIATTLEASATVHA